MKKGEVAVENSVIAMRDLKGNKLKERVPMVRYASDSPHNRKSHQQDVTLRLFQPHSPAPPVSMVYPHQSLAVMQPYPLMQPLPAHQRYGAATSRSFGLSRSASVGQRHRAQQQPPPPPPDDASSGASVVKENVAQHRVATISLPVQLHASAVETAPHTRAKRQVCVRYARGNCYFGSSCKFYHTCDDATGIPRSAPGAPSENRLSTKKSPTSSDDQKKNRIEIPSSLQDSNFPSLPVFPNASDRSRNQSESERLEAIAHSSSTKMIFRDAVLRHKVKSDEEKSAIQPPPTDAPEISDEEQSVSTDDELGSTRDQDGPRGEKDEAETEGDGASSSGNNKVNGPLRRGRLSAQDTSASRRDYRSQRGPSQLERFLFQHQLQLVHPDLGNLGYAIQPVYLLSDGRGSDDSAVFSVLSRSANEFVRRIDSRLRFAVCLQQRALAKLQDVATKIWADSTISVYGSNYTRLALPQSDVDCVLSTAAPASSEKPVELLRKLECDLRRQAWVRQVELVDGAKIPVLKIVFSQSTKPNAEVMLDLTCAHSPGHSGLGARQLIYSYQAEMPALRPLVLILKSHLQRRGLNSAYTGGLSSYGLVLLVIRFLQACGDGHRLRERSLIPLNNSPRSPTEQLNRQSAYEFVRDGILTWRTGLGNLLLLFLETYVTFDYRRFGVTVEGCGQYFALPPDKVSLEPGSVVSPYIVDPLETTRSIGKCFRMHEVIQAWYELYQRLASGVPLEDAIDNPAHALRQPQP